MLSFFKTLEPGDPKLIFSVNDSDDGMVSGEAKAWIQVSRERSNMLCYVLEDDDGKSELNRYDFSLEGLADCLDSLCSLQDEVEYEEFYEAVKELVS